MTEINNATKFNMLIKSSITFLKERLFLAAKCCFTYKINSD